jgi:hypothetical protein
MEVMMDQAMTIIEYLPMFRTADSIPPLGAAFAHGRYNNNHKNHNNNNNNNHLADGNNLKGKRGNTNAASQALNRGENNNSPPRRAPPLSGFKGSLTSASISLSPLNLSLLNSLRTVVAVSLAQTVDIIRQRLVTVALHAMEISIQENILIPAFDIAESLIGDGEQDAEDERPLRYSVRASGRHSAMGAVTMSNNNNHHHHHHRIQKKRQELSLSGGHSSNSSKLSKKRKKKKKQVVDMLSDLIRKNEQQPASDEITLKKEELALLAERVIRWESRRYVETVVEHGVKEMNRRLKLKLLQVLVDEL